MYNQPPIEGQNPTIVKGSLASITPHKGRMHNHDGLPKAARQCAFTPKSIARVDHSLGRFFTFGNLAPARKL